MEEGVGSSAQGIFTISTGREGAVVPHLVIEVVFWKVEGQGKYREQELPNSHRRVTNNG